MQLRVLGPIEIYNGHKLAIGGPRQRRIIAALAVQPGEVVSLDRLVDIIWAGEEMPKQAERNVRTYVHRIRQALGDDLADRLETAPPGYVFRLKADELDAGRFERSYAEAGRLRDRGDSDGALVRIEEALDLWRGDPYAEFGAESWARVEATRLVEIRVSALELRCQVHLDLNRAPEALAELGALIADHPLREGPRALYMQALYRSGRQAEALRAFQGFRDYLIDEAGVTPTDDLVELDRSIASGDLPHSGSSQQIRGYEIHELIGRGAFAEVHRGWQPGLGREVAVKAIQAELANRPEFIRGFEAEAAIIARLEHPYIVPLYDFWREPDQAYLVMRWLPGGSLESRIGSGPLSIEQTAEMVEQVGSALALAHRSGVVHRDVKSANILLDGEGNSYLADFGIAVDVAGDKNPAASLSEGSPAYASPEQIRREHVGPAADIHGLAIAAYEALTGQLPFPDSTDRPTLLRRQLNEPIPAATLSRPELPQAVDDVLAVATAKDPSARYQDVATFVADFVKALADSPTSSPALRDSARRATDISGIVDNPYKGLHAFAEGDADQFFGRERLVDELLAHLEGVDGKFLAVVGASGCGKSSVVRAGLVPALRNGRVEGSEDWFITTMAPGSHPFEALESAFLRIAVNPPASLLSQLEGDRRGIVRATRRILPDDDGTAVLVIDQFEELFTLCRDEAVRAKFLQSLTAAVDDPATTLRIIITLRADFYDQPLRYEGFAELLKRHAVTVTPLFADELEQAILGPAQSVGAEFEPGLVAEMVADVTSQPSALPLMQYALTQLFDARVSGILMVSAYRRLGGLSGALAGRADELFGDLESDVQQAARRLFGRLVTLGEGSEDTRRRVTRSELGRGPAVDRVIDVFGAARLLSFDRDTVTRAPTIEVAHEALIREWPRLRGWLDEDRDGLRIHRHLTAAAGAWNDRDRDPSELYRGGRLEGVQGWSRDHGGDLNETEAAFIGAGIKARRAEQAEERKRVSRLRRLLAGAGALLVLALVAGGLALRSQSQAQDREADAEAARSIAETRRIGADAAQLVDTNRRVALLLAAEAYHRDPGPESLGALQRVLSQTGSFLGYLGADRQYRRVAWAGTERVVGLHPSGVDIYDTASGERMVDIDFLAGEALAVSPDGASVAMGASSGPVHLVDAVSGELERELPHPAVVRSIAFSPDSSLVATGDRNGDLRLWSTESGQLLSERDAHWEREVGDLPDGVELGGSAHEPATMPIGVHRLTFSPDGGRIATTGGVFVRVWDVDGLELLTDITVDRVSSVSAQGRGLGRPFDVVFAEGDLLHVATDIFLQTWDSRTGELLVENAPLTGVTAAGFEAFALDVHEDVAVLGTPAGTLRTVRVDSGQIVSVVEIDGGFETQGFDVEIADDGRTVAAAAGGIALFSLDGRGLIADTVAASGLEEILVSADGTRATTTTPRLSSAGVWDLAGRRPAPVSVPDGFYRFFSDHFGPLVGVYAEGSDVYYERLDPETYEPTGLTLGPYSAWQATASPDGSILALGLGRPDLALVKILDTETGQEVTTLMELAGQGGAAVSTLAFNPDGSRLAAAADTGVAHVWDTTTWEPVGPPIAEGGQAVIAMSYSIDGDELLTVNGEGVTTVRDAESYQPTGRQFLGSRNFVSGWQQFGFSDDGQYMVVSLDSQPRLYDYPSGIRIGRAFPGDQALVNVTPDARYATTIIDGTGLIWNLDVDDWVEIACRAAGRNLRVEEWTQFGPTDQPHGATCPQWPSLADEQGD